MIMIPAGNSTDNISGPPTDGANPNNMEAAIEEEQKKAANYNTKPSMYKNLAAKGIQYAVIAITGVGMTYKMFFADTANDKNKKKSKVAKGTTTSLADAPTSKVTSSSISNEKLDLNNKSIINEVKMKEPDMVALEKPQLPDVPKIEIITKVIEEKKEIIPETIQDIKEDITSKSISTIKEVLPPTSNSVSSLPPISPNNADNNNLSSPLNEIDNIKRKENKKNDNSNLMALQTPEEAMKEMFVLSGSGPSQQNQIRSSAGGSKNDFIIIDDTNLSIQTASEAGVENKTSTKRLNNLDTTIAAGKFIEAILESAINSQIPGIVRAVVSRDVIGEVGNKTLIPKGSRLYGTYSATVANGQSRLAIIWNKILRPDGIVVAISAQVTDQFGRAGIEGDVDTKYLEMFQNSLLLSFITLGTAVALEKVAGVGGQSQVVNNNGSVATTNITPANAAAQSIIATSTDIAKQMTQGLMKDLKPTISIPGGILLNVMVNQDIQIPPYKKVQNSFK